jgi:hypothetical protein
LFIAPAAPPALRYSARQDLLFDLTRFSGEPALDILNRGGKLDVTPLFFRPNAAALSISSAASSAIRRQHRRERR